MILSKMEQRYLIQSLDGGYSLSVARPMVSGSMTHGIVMAHGQRPKALSLDFSNTLGTNISVGTDSVISIMHPVHNGLCSSSCIPCIMRKWTLPMTNTHYPVMPIQYPRSNELKHTAPRPRSRPYDHAPCSYKPLIFNPQASSTVSLWVILGLIQHGRGHGIAYVQCPIPMVHG